MEEISKKEIRTSRFLHHLRQKRCNSCKHRRQMSSLLSQVAQVIAAEEKVSESWSEPWSTESDENEDQSDGEASVISPLLSMSTQPEPLRARAYAVEKSVLDTGHLPYLLRPQVRSLQTLFMELISAKLGPLEQLGRPWEFLNLVFTSEVHSMR